MADDIGPMIPTHTPPQANGDGSVHYLDRHNIKCNYGFAIGSIHLRRVDPNLTYNQYDYTCLYVPNIQNCIVKTTNAVSSERSSSLSLLNPALEVKCDPDQVLNQVQLKTVAKNSTIQYTYTCCSR